MKRKLLFSVVLVVVILLSMDIRQVSADCEILQVITIFAGTMVKVNVNNTAAVKNKIVVETQYKDEKGVWKMIDRDTKTLEAGKNGTTRGLNRIAGPGAMGIRVLIKDDFDQEKVQMLGPPIGGFSFPIEISADNFSSNSVAFFTLQICSALSIIGAIIAVGSCVRRAKREE